jgi:hypothetical protein
MNGSLLFNARQAYETPPTHNNRSRADGGVCDTNAVAKPTTF